MATESSDDKSNIEGRASNEGSGETKEDELMTDGLNAAGVDRVLRQRLSQRDKQVARLQDQLREAKTTQRRLRSAAGPLDDATGSGEIHSSTQARVYPTPEQRQQDTQAQQQVFAQQEEIARLREQIFQQQQWLKVSRSALSTVNLPMQQQMSGVDAAPPGISAPLVAPIPD